MALDTNLLKRVKAINDLEKGARMTEIFDLIAENDILKQEVDAKKNDFIYGGVFGALLAAAVFALSLL
jgi:hypothetical protein